MSNFQKLQQWLKTNDSLQMLEKDSRGIISTKNIKKGDIVMEIPSKYLIELSVIKKYVFKFIKHDFENTNSIMAVYLLLESFNDKTKWKHYLDVMPKDFSHYIHFYDKLKLGLLKDTSMMCKDTYNFKYNIDNIKKDAIIVYHKLKEYNKIPNEYLNINKFIQLFMKFRIIVDSRTFNYEKKRKDESGLVPYADLLNHSNDCNTTWAFDDSKNAFVVLATKDIKKNTEIYDSYGEKSNVKLVLYYGFSIKNNPHSNLSFIYKNNLVNIEKNSNLNEILYIHDLENYKKKIVELLKKKLMAHQQTIKKTNDINIQNIIEDEIKIIQSLV